MRSYLSSSLLIWGVLGSSIGGEGAYAATRTPEEETLWLAKQLRPIPDEQWKEIAGARTTEKYEIVKGDTLYDISKRLFGDSKYWPKIWALNNGAIMNPHLIRPGNRINFLPGSGTSLPTLGIQSGDGETKSVAQKDSPKNSNDSQGETESGVRVRDRVSSSQGRSMEWKKLPRQVWESVDIAPSADIDPQGFDKRSKISYRKGDGILPYSQVASEPLNSLGTISGSTSLSSFFFISDVVLIKAKDELQVGEVYSIVGPPNVLKSKESGRQVYSYVALGEVKIIGVKDNLFIGSIQSASSYIERGNQLIHRIRKERDAVLIPAPNPVEASILLDRALLSTDTTGQHRQVFVDRGSDDGVRPGMVFRVFLHNDPTNKKTITESDFLVLGDVVVVQTSERASSCVVLRSFSAIDEFSRAVLLTDVSDLVVARRKSDHGMDTKGNGDIDGLDRLDVSGGLGRKEAEELRQLERWQKNNGGATPPPAKVESGKEKGAPPADFEKPPTADSGSLDNLLNDPAAPSGATPPNVAEPTPPAPPAPDTAAAPPGGGDAGAIDNLLDAGAPPAPTAPTATAPPAAQPTAPSAPPSDEVGALDNLLNQ